MRPKCQQTPGGFCRGLITFLLLVGGSRVLNGMGPLLDQSTKMGIDCQVGYFVELAAGAAAVPAAGLVVGFSVDLSTGRTARLATGLYVGLSTRLSTGPAAVPAAGLSVVRTVRVPTGRVAGPASVLAAGVEVLAADLATVPAAGL